MENIKPALMNEILATFLWRKESRTDARIRIDSFAYVYQQDSVAIQRPDLSVLMWLHRLNPDRI